MNNRTQFLKLYYSCCFLVSGIFLLATVLLPLFIDKTGILWDMFGLICHQNPERCIFVSGVSMPLCARCFGMAIGTFVACCVGLFVMPSGSFFERCMAYFHLSGEDSMKYLAVILMILMIPMMADGFIQLVSSYESNNFLRVLTGTLFGYARGLLLSSALLTCILYLQKIRLRCVDG